MSGEYDRTIETLENSADNISKKIDVKILLSQKLSNGSKLLKINISDCGKGFDFISAIKLAKYPFGDSLRGRGLKMSLDSVGGLYYNVKGKNVTLLDCVHSKFN
jgi:hypothetical protein